MRWTAETVREAFPLGSEVLIIDVGDDSLTHRHYTSNEHMRKQTEGVVVEVEMYGTLPKVMLEHHDGYRWTYHPSDLAPIKQEEPEDTKLWAICIDADELEQMGQAGYKVEKVKNVNGIAFDTYSLRKYNRYIGRLEDGRMWGLDEDKVHLIHDCDWLHAKDLVMNRGMKCEVHGKDVTPTQLAEDMKDALTYTIRGHYHRLEQLLQDE